MNKIIIKKVFLFFIILITFVLGCQSVPIIGDKTKKLYKITGQVQITPQEKINFSNLEVKLININDNGNQVGDKIESSKLDMNGNYSIAVDADKVILPSTDTILEVNLDKDKVLRAFVTGDNVNINYITTTLVKLITDLSEPLNVFNTEGILQLYSVVEKIAKNIDTNQLSLVQAIDNLYNSTKQNNEYQAILQKITKSTISGTVLTPSGKLAYKFIDNINNFISPYSIAYNGFLPLEKGVKVSLYRIDNQGNLLGSELASSHTINNGKYTITLPANISPSSELVVLVGDKNETLMRALVYNYITDISPISETVFRLITNNDKVTDSVKQPLNKFNNEKIYQILNSVNSIVSNMNLNHSSIDKTVSYIYNSILDTPTLKASISKHIGIPSPYIEPLPAVVNNSIVTLKGSASQGALIEVTGGKTIASHQLEQNTKDFVINVSLYENTENTLYVVSKFGNESSLPNIIKIKHDNIKPAIDLSKIEVLDQNNKLVIRGYAGAISDISSVRVIITNPHNTNLTVSVQASSNGEFSATLDKGEGITLNLQAIDEANNFTSINLPIQNPKLVIDNIYPNYAAGGDLINITGLGFEAYAPANSVVFTSSFTSFTMPSTALSNDGKTLSVVVPNNLVLNLSKLPAKISVKVVNQKGESNVKEFVLVPSIKKLNTNLLSTGEHPNIFYFPSKNILLANIQQGTISKLIKMNLEGDILVNDLTNTLNTIPNKLQYSIFTDIDIDKNSNLVISNFDTSLLGEIKSYVNRRPNYRITKYIWNDDQITEFEDISNELSEEPLNDKINDFKYKVGPIAIKDDYAYVSVPKIGKILRVNMVNKNKSTFVQGLPTPIKDIIFDNIKQKLYISAGEDINLFKMVLDSYQETNEIENKSINAILYNIGKGAGKLAMDYEGNIYITVGVGIEKINPIGEKSNLLHSISGKPLVSIISVNNLLYTVDIDGNFYKIFP